MGDAADAGHVRSQLYDHGDGPVGDGCLHILGNSRGRLGIGGEGFAETVLHIGAGDVYLDAVGAGGGDAAGDVAELGGCAGKDAGDDENSTRLQPRAGLMQQADFLVYAGIGQPNRIEEAAAPVDAGGVDMTAAGGWSATLGGYRAAAGRGGALQKADRRAPDAARQHKRRGQFAAQKCD